MCARMEFLVVLLSIMHFAVVDKHTVSPSGDLPGSATAVYCCSYQKGQVRTGDSAVLEISHLGGITIERIEMGMRGNAKSGAGVIEVKANGTVIAERGMNWQNVSEATEVFAGKQQGVQSLRISLTGVQNSLYVDSYSITWSAAPPRDVLLMCGGTEFDTLQEVSGNAGVILPVMADTATWQFIGWSEREFWAEYEMPQVYPAGSRFFPTANDTLWATYVYDEEAEMKYITELKDGEYRYVNRINNLTMTGVPENGMMANAAADISDEEQVYRFEFRDDGTAYITHVATGAPIGYKGAEMAISASPWSVYHEEDQTFFYATIEGKNYVLWPNIPYQGHVEILYAGLFAADPGESPMGLLPIYEKEAPVYTCHPEWRVGIEEVEDAAGKDIKKERVVMHVGGYQLVIKNGKKYLVIQ